MKIVINDFGSKISLKENTIIIHSKDKKDILPLECISEIIISNSCLITSNIIHKCVLNNIQIIFLDEYGYPYLYIENLNNACSPILKRKQLILQKSIFGVNLVKETITQKLQNRQLHLNNLAKNRKLKVKDDIKQSVISIQKYIDLIKSLQSDNVLDIRNIIQSYEGNAGKIYFKQISDLLEHRYKFQGRSFKPAKDYYNCMLNYSYGVMYSKIGEFCINARLDIYIGIMHADIYNKPTLTYDLIEPYRYYCEKVVFKLFSKRMIKNDMFYEVDGGYFLNKDGKKVLLKEFYTELDKKVKVNGKNITINNKIKNDMLLLAKAIGESNIC